MGRCQRVFMGDQKASAATWGEPGEEEGHPSQMLLITGELTFRYHHVEVIGNLGKNNLGDWSSSRGNGRRGSEEGHCRQLFEGAFHCKWDSC